MQIEATLASAVENPRWVVDELIDFMESCLPRNPRDLKLHGLRVSDSLFKAAEWLDNDPSQCAKVSLESIAASVAVPALNEIITQANRRLRRTRQLVPLESLRAQDARCLMWLARRPGNNLNEKLTKDRRLLGVVRELSFDVLENRVANQTALMLNRLLITECLAWDKTVLRKTRATCTEFLDLAESNNIRPLAHAPRPNNALLRDRNYRRIWLAYRWLLARDEFRESVGNHLCRSTAEALALVVGGLPRSLGFGFADAAVPSMSRPTPQCAWLRDYRMRWVRFGEKSMDLLDVSLEETGGQSRVLVRWRGHRTGRQETLAEPAKAMILSPQIRNGRLEVSISGDVESISFALAEGSQDLRQIAHWLRNSLSAWNGVTSATLDPVPVAGSFTNRVLRFTGNEVLSGERGIDCFCGNLCLKTEDGTDSVILVGAGARNRRILGMDGVSGREWITPGRLSRALSRPGATGSAFASLMKAADYDGETYPLEAIAVPAALPFGFESAIRAALRPNAGDCWLVPQPVTSAIAAAWDGNPVVHPELDEFVCSIDFDGERVDASLLRWTNIPLPGGGEKSPGWLHFREIREANQLGPRTMNLVFKVLARAILSAGVSKAELHGACMQALHQLKLPQLWNLLKHPNATLDVWVSIQTGNPRCCEIRPDDCRIELIEWLSSSVFPWLEQRLEFWQSREKRVSTIIFNGSHFGVTELRQIFDEWSGSAASAKAVFLEGDQVQNGLGIFLKRQSANKVTWSEHLPVLEILGSNTQNQAQWLRMFDEDASVSPGGRILLGPLHAFSADKRTLSVPMRCDGERGRQDPYVIIPDACPLPMAVDVQAQYDVGRAGLMLIVRSKEAGVMPEVTMEWGMTVHTPDEPQQIQVYDDPLEVSEIERINHRLRTAMDYFLDRNGGQNQLKSAIDGVARSIGGSLRSAEPSAWRNVNRDEIVGLVGRLSWLHKTGVSDYHSALFSAPRWRLEFTSGTGRNRRTICLGSPSLQVSITRAIGKMRSAAPYGFIDWCAENAIGEQDQSLRHECIRCVGRAFGPDGNPSRDRILAVYDRIFLKGESQKTVPPEDSSIWYWSLHAALSHSAGSAGGFGLERIVAILDALRFDLECLSAKPDSVDPALLRNLLAAMLAARHGTRLEGGMGELGPESTRATGLVATLNGASTAFGEAWDQRKLGSITILGFLDDSKGVTAFRSTNPIAQVGEIWDGKVKALLRQVAETE